MDPGAVRSPPYRAGLGLVHWVRQPGRWHELEGECLSRGVDLRSLSYDRFLNVVYHAMLARLKYDHEHPERARQALDSTLSVAEWRVPGATWRPSVASTRPANAPAWWHGDEDASQSFLSSMGVRM